MEKYIITTESGSDISQEEAKKLGIEVIPMHVTMGDQCLDDGYFPPEDVCKYFNETKSVPKTSGCSPYDFEVFFDRVHEENPDSKILHLAYSAATTVSYASACSVSEDRDYVTVIDTKHVSVGLRVCVLKALEIIKNEPEIMLSELVEKIKASCAKVKMSFIPSDLVYLHAGGRCSNLAYKVGQMLHLHPCIDVQDGLLIATKKYVGDYKKVLREFIHDCAKKYPVKNSEVWFIWTAGFSDLLKNHAGSAASGAGLRIVHWVKAGSVITCHGGESAFGFVCVAE